MPKGKLFVFEGPDGNGKTTLVDNVYRLLQKDELPVSKLSFPGKKENTLGKLVYNLHHDSKQYGIDKIPPASLQTLHVAAHIESIYRFISPAIEAGKILLLDRYWWSTYVYGLCSGTHIEVMKVLIKLETMHWVDLLPKCVFLVVRESAPLRKEMPLDEWLTLQNIYEELQKVESLNYPTMKLLNEDSPEAIAEKVYEYIKNSDEIQ